jgi:hypothetical protein
MLFPLDLQIKEPIGMVLEQQLMTREGEKLQSHLTPAGTRT